MVSTKSEIDRVGSASAAGAGSPSPRYPHHAEGPRPTPKRSTRRSRHWARRRLSADHLSPGRQPPDTRPIAALRFRAAQPTLRSEPDPSALSRCDQPVMDDEGRREHGGGQQEHAKQILGSADAVHHHGWSGWRWRRRPLSLLPTAHGNSLLDGSRFPGAGEPGSDSTGRHHERPKVKIKVKVKSGSAPDGAIQHHAPRGTTPHAGTSEEGT